MKKQNTLFSAGIACMMALGLTMTSYANFSWNIDEGYLGTATVLLTEQDGTQHLEDAVLVKDGTIVLFTELNQYSVDFGEGLYDYNGFVNPAEAGLGISDMMNPGGCFLYVIRSEVYSSWAVGAPEAGVYYIYSFGNEDEMSYYQYFVIDGKYNPELMLNVQRTEPEVPETPETPETPDTPENAETPETPQQPEETGHTTETLAPDADNTALTYSWASDETGWWVQCSDGSYLVNQWYCSPESGLWYYMGADGYMMTNATTPDGCVVDANGVWQP